ncbi:MAG TPA: sugar ABC transporter ATP-binding protein [Terrimicrobiaceae bacterium]
MQTDQKMDTSSGSPEVGSSELLLSAKEITKSFSGVPALRDGRLSLRAGSIHALCGGNGAGKSTFLNIITGILRKDSGTIVYKGSERDFHAPKESLDAGISIITQELSPVREMTVAENLYLGHLPERYSLVDWKELFRNASELLERLGFDINPRKKMREISLAQIQLVEIAKAINHRDVSILIMDEPTSALGEQETEVLFSSVRGLASLGKGIIYVSHRMTEIFTICDAYTVLRDGRFIEDGLIKDITRKHLVSKIIGRDYQDQFPETKAEITAEPVLRVKNFSIAGKLTDINLEVHKGEVLGIYGLVGSGRSEFLNGLYGLDKLQSGEVLLNNRHIAVRSPRESLRNGLALVTEDRKETGLVLTSSVKENMSLSSLPSLSQLGFMRHQKEKALTDEWVRKLRIKCASIKLQVRFMSGGNQQKVVLARALETEPRLLLLDEPTRGVDAGAKQEIYGFIEEFVENGNGVIMVSSEVDEVLGMSTRILIFRRGKITAEMNNQNLTAADLLHAAS